MNVPSKNTGALRALLMVLVLSCQSALPTPPPAPPAATPEPTLPRAASLGEPLSIPPGTDPGFDPTAIDRSTSPCDDFYQFACGGWLAHTEIPADRGSWGRAFNVIQEANLARLRAILESLAAGNVAAGDSVGKKLGDFYAACTDEAAAEATFAREVAPKLKKIGAVKDARALAKHVAESHLEGRDVLFAFGSDQDFKDATQVIGTADQAGLGLPERDYYLRDDPKMAEIREQYVEHVTRMLELAGEPHDAAARGADAVMRIETALARGSMPIVDRRDPFKIYHRLERAGLEKRTPRFPWKTYLERIGTPTVTAINVVAPDFFSALNDLLGAGVKDDLRTYLRWHVLHQAAPAIGKAFVDEDFRFNSAALTGAPQNQPRWKRCVRAADKSLGEALAQPFVRDTFGADGKERAIGMIRGIEHAFEKNLEALTWMDADTKGQALDKSRRVVNKIGYPDKWRDYGPLAIERRSYLGNVLRAATFEVRRGLGKIGKPLDRTEWQMTPPTVNAYYAHQLTEMVFPAGILQPPFFSRTAPEAANYGGIGMVMGHELTHGFDDQGRKFDGAGNLRDWWLPAVAKSYEDKAACIAEQYGAYEPLPGVKVNGRLTLGENIADLGGLKLAHAAHRASTAMEAVHLAGMSADQQFFVAFAQSWCTKRREATERALVNTDTHAPPRFRVNGSVANTPAFSEAFQCPAGSPMAPSKRCAVW